MINKLKQLCNHGGFRRYAANTSWLFVERIARMGITLLVGVYVVRYLGPSQFGQLSYAQSFVALFTPLAALGLDGVVVRDLVKTPGKKLTLLGTAFWLKLCGAGLSLLLMLGAVVLTDNTPQDNLFILLLAIGLFFQSLNVVDLFFQSQVQSRSVVKIQLTQTVATSLLKVFLLWIKAPLWVFVSSYVFDAIFVALGFLLLAKTQGLLDIFRKFDFAVAKGLLRDSMPLVFSGLAVALYMRVDQVMLKEMLGSNAVGQFSAALKLSEAWYFIPIAICNSLFPAIVAAKSHNEAIYHTRMQHLYDLMVILSVLVAIPVTFFAEPIIYVLYGAAFDEAVTVLKIHIWTAPFVFLGVAMGGWLIAEGLSKKSLYRTVFGFVVNVSANLYLIPSYGPAGAAAATLLGQVAANFLYDLFDPDVRDQLHIKMRALMPIHLLRNKV